MHQQQGLAALRLALAPRLPLSVAHALRFAAQTASLPRASCALLRPTLPPHLHARPPQVRAYSRGGGGGGGFGGGGFRVPPFLTRGTWPVSALIALNCAVCAWYWLDDTPSAHRRWQRRFLLSRASFANDPLVLLRSMFAHVSPLHLFFNMFSLHSFGGGALATLGALRFVALYLGAGLVGGLAQLQYPVVARALGFPAAARSYSLSDTPSLGASGAVFGLIGFTGALSPRSEVAFFFIPMQQRVFLALVLGGSAYACYAGVDGGGIQLGHAAHLGGALVGIGAGLLVKRRGWR